MRPAAESDSRQLTELRGRHSEDGGRVCGGTGLWYGRGEFWGELSDDLFQPSVERRS